MRARLVAAEQAREVVLCGAISAAVSTLFVFTLPHGGDLAAHLYRTALVQRGIYVWDNLWFAGQYPLSSYSLLYYLLAAVVGNPTLGIAGVVVAAAVFASIAEREWKSAGRWPARVFALLVVGQAFTAAYPYDLGLAMLLATLWALQRRRAWLAGCTTLLTLGFSPLAFVFLALALLALSLRHRRIGRQTVIVAGAVALAAGLQLAVLELLPTPGIVYPYGTWRLLAGLGVSGLGLALALRGRGGWPLASMFLILAVASVVFDLVPSPVGHNLVRASLFVVPLMFVAAGLADFRPRLLAIAGILAALAANVAPYLAMIRARSSTAASGQSFWSPVIHYLRIHSTADFRVEVVPTANHWEAYYPPCRIRACARVVPPARHRRRRNPVRSAPRREPLSRVAASARRPLRRRSSPAAGGNRRNAREEHSRVPKFRLDARPVGPGGDDLRTASRDSARHRPRRSRHHDARLEPHRRLCRKRGDILPPSPLQPVLVGDSRLRLPRSGKGLHDAVDRRRAGAVHDPGSGNAGGRPRRGSRRRQARVQTRRDIDGEPFSRQLSRAQATRRTGSLHEPHGIRPSRSATSRSSCRPALVSMNSARSSWPRRAKSPAPTSSAN